MPEYIKDAECSRDTPVIWGKLSDRSYGTGKRIKPNIDGKHATDYEKKIYLPELLPLEEYDLVIVLFSGGKDSTAAYFKLLELGVPKNKIELWHHDIDGKNKERRMDWPCTQEYVKAFAEREKVTLRVSWRDQGSGAKFTESAQAIRSGTCRTEKSKPAASQNSRSEVKSSANNWPTILQRRNSRN